MNVWGRTWGVEIWGWLGYTFPVSDLKVVLGCPVVAFSDVINSSWRFLALRSCFNSNSSFHILARAADSSSNALMEFSERARRTLSHFLRSLSLLSSSFALFCSSWGSGSSLALSLCCGGSVISASPREGFPTSCGTAGFACSWDPNATSVPGSTLSADCLGVDVGSLGTTLKITFCSFSLVGALCVGPGVITAIWVFGSALTVALSVSFSSVWVGAVLVPVGCLWGCWDFSVGCWACGDRLVAACSSSFSYLRSEHPGHINSSASFLRCSRYSSLDTDGSHVMWTTLVCWA